jgi:hypothetical protein
LLVGIRLELCPQLEAMFPLSPPVGTTLELTKQFI